MSTVASRTFKSTPERDASRTWNAIVDLLTGGKAGEVRTELVAITGIAASVIADQAPKGAPITVTCDGPRTRIYCAYDDDAIEGSDVNEDPLGFDPLEGDWRISLPCEPVDLTWVQSALKRHSSRITARDVNTTVASADEAPTAKAQTLVFDSKGFLGV